ncbi:MAG: hypothetical protein ACI9OJ_004294, partial [Myxococcota bacterium]
DAFSSDRSWEANHRDELIFRGVFGEAERGGRDAISIGLQGGRKWRDYRGIAARAREQSKGQEDSLCCHFHHRHASNSQPVQYLIVP